MIPIIGIMIGFYILTRMIELVSPHPGHESTVAVVLAYITMLVAVVGMILLLSSGTDSVFG